MNSIITDVYRLGINDKPEQKYRSIIYKRHLILDSPLYKDDSGKIFLHNSSKILQGVSYEYTHRFDLLDGKNNEFDVLFAKLTTWQAIWLSFYKNMDNATRWIKNETAKSFISVLLKMGIGFLIGYIAGYHNS